MAYSFDDAGAADRHTTQYFEMFCNRGIYHEGWTAVTRHSIPWVATEMPAFDDDVWELYGPERLDAGARPRGRAAREARRAPAAVPDRGARSTTCCPSTTVGSSASTPTSPGGHSSCVGTSQLLFGRMGRLSENSIVVMKNKSHSITAEIEVPEGGANGVILSQGGAFGGCALYAKDGKLAYCYNLFGLQQFKVYSADPIPAGTHQVRMEFAYDGGGSAREATSASTSTASRSARDASRGRCRCSSPPTRRPMSAATRRRRSATTTGRETASSRGRCTGCRSTRRGGGGRRPLISPEERFRVAMARQ